MGKMRDSEIIKYLANGQHPEVGQALGYLHRRVYRQVSTLIKRNLGSSTDTEDIFQDALLVLYKLAKRGSLAEDTNVEAYLFAICKNLWFQQLRKRKEMVPIEDPQLKIKVAEVPLFRMMKEEEQKELKNLIGQLGANCKKVLINFYYKRMRMREIATQMGYSSEQVAKNQKSQCMKKLKQLAYSSPIFKNKMT